MEFKHLNTLYLYLKADLSLRENLPSAVEVLIEDDEFSRYFDVEELETKSTEVTLDAEDVGDGQYLSVVKAFPDKALDFSDYDRNGREGVFELVIKDKSGNVIPYDDGAQVLMTLDELLDQMHVGLLKDDYEEALVEKVSEIISELDDEEPSVELELHPETDYDSYGSKQLTLTASAMDCQGQKIVESMVVICGSASNEFGFFENEEALKQDLKTDCNTLTATLESSVDFGDEPDEPDDALSR